MERMSERGTAELERMQAAQEEVQRLRSALAAAGITLPSLGLDLSSCTGSADTPLLDLGRVNLDTARALVALVESRAGAA